MNLSGSRILVTGGAGLVGSTTIDILLAEDDPARIVVLDNMVRGSEANLRDALRDPRVEWIRGDIRDATTVDRLVSESDVVVHMAALRITACAADPREAHEVMGTGTFHVVDAAARHKVAKVVTASSASVLGLAESFPTVESHHPYGNRTLYGAYKVWLEGLLRAYNEMHGLQYVAHRYFNVYGPRMDIHGKYTEVMIRWMERIESGVPPLILGDGTTTMDFVHIRDVARANVLALRSDVSDEVFHVASGVETSLLELAAALQRAMGAPEGGFEFGPERSVNPVPRRLADVSKAEEMLGFRARIGLDEGLLDLVSWWRENRG